MATYVLIHGAGGSSWYWHLVEPRLAELGHKVVAVDLPCDDDRAGLAEYTDAVVDAVRERRHDLVVVAQSLAGFTAPLVCSRLPVDLLVLLAAMVPAPRETAGEWWANTGQAEAQRAQAAREGRTGDDDLATVFFHDVPPDLAAQAMAGGRRQSGTPFQEPWPLDAWPDVATKFLLCRQDRLFPADFQRRVVGERLGIVPDEMDGGHLPALARPDELATRLDAYWPVSARRGRAPA